MPTNEGELGVLIPNRLIAWEHVKADGSYHWQAGGMAWRWAGGILFLVGCSGLLPIIRLGTYQMAITFTLGFDAGHQFGRTLKARAAQ